MERQLLALSIGVHEAPLSVDVKPIAEALGETGAVEANGLDVDRLFASIVPIFFSVS